MFRRVMWGMFGLAAALAFAAYQIGGDDPHRGLMAGFGVALGLGLLARGQAGVEEGSIRGRSRRISRAENPGVFWGIVGLQYLLGVALAAGTIVWATR